MGNHCRSTPNLIWKENQKLDSKTIVKFAYLESLISDYAR